MPNYKKKPAVIEAHQWLPNDLERSGNVVGWLMAHNVDFEIVEDRQLSIITLEGAMRASDGDWIIKGVNNEFYPCKPDIFEKTYEPLEDTHGYPRQFDPEAEQHKLLDELES